MSEMSKTMQTTNSFKDKWTPSENYFFSETLRKGSDIQNWIVRRNGFSDTDEFSRHLSKFKNLLDAGCGNGRVTALLNKLTCGKKNITAVDLVGAPAARNFLGENTNIRVHDGDLLDDLSWLGKFDFIYCQEVLHHTADPKGAFNNLVNILEPGGELAIYVYKKKGEIREFSDEFLRSRISHLSFPDALSACAQITEFGKILSELDIQIHVPSIDSLNIKEGTYDLQRLIYNHFLKCFWNKDLSYDENVLINYDWYHPQTASKHQLSEVVSWFSEAGLEIIHVCEDDYGITVRGISA